MKITTSPRPPRMLSLILGASLFAATAVLADPNAPCYFPGGGPALGYFPCHAYGAEISSCCAPGWTCFSNSLCIATTETRSWPNISIGSVQRGACTAPKWNNEFCGSSCLTGDGIDGRLAACGNDRYCCWSDFEAGKCDCDEGGGSFVVNAGLPQTIIQVTDTTFTGSPPISIVTTKPSPRATTDSTSASTTGSTLVTSVTSGSGGAASATSTGTGTPEPDDDDKDGKTLKIALGVAIPIGVLALLGAAAFLFFKRRREFLRGGRDDGQDDQPPVAESPAPLHEGLAETYQYAPSRSFGPNYDGYDGAGHPRT